MKTKLIVVVVLIAFLLKSFSMPALGDDQIYVLYNGEEIIFDVNPTIISGRTLVPMRAIFEAFGATVNYDSQTKTITAERTSQDEGTRQIILSIGNKNSTVSINGIGKGYLLDVEPLVINGRTLVPLRFIGEALGAIVNWDGKTKTVTIISSNGSTGETIEYYTQGTVEGRGWIGPLHYHVRGLPLGSIAVENNNLHRYDTGKFFGPGTFQIWGEAYNNAHDLADSQEYSFGVMTLRILIRYEDKDGNIKTLIDSRVEDEHGQLVAPRFAPGSMEFSFTVIIPDDVKQTPGRSSVMIEIRHHATWGTGGNNLAANLQFSSD